MPTQQTTAPSALPVTRDALKAHLRITSTAEDDLLDTYLAVAVNEIDGAGLLGAAMLRASYMLTTGRPAGRDVALEIGPAQSLEAISVVRPSGDVEVLDPAGFTLISDGEQAIVRGFWGAVADRFDAIRITYIAGMAATPEELPAGLRHAVTLLAAHRFEVREEVVIGTIVATLPIGVDRLIQLERRRVFG